MRLVIILIFVILFGVSACNLSETAPEDESEALGASEVIDDATPIPPIPEALSTATQFTLISTTPTIAGVVWHDLCETPAEAVNEPPVGCIVSDSRGYVANGILEAGEVGIQRISVTLGQGACPSDGLAEATTDESGSYRFTNISAGIYCVTVNELLPENLALLAPGAWTAPVLDSNSLTVTLAAGQSVTDANFGWDYQFAP
jgi:hypothetical protein